MSAGVSGGPYNGESNGAAEGRHAGVPSEASIVCGPTDYEVPLSSVGVCYEYPGTVVVHDKGRDSDETFALGAQNPSLGSPSPPVTSYGERGDVPFDIRNPAVAPDTGATNIWGS